MSFGYCTERRVCSSPFGRAIGMAAGIARRRLARLGVARRLHQLAQLLGRLLAARTRFACRHLQGDGQDLLLVTLHMAAEQRDDLLGRGHRDRESLLLVSRYVLTGECRLNEAKI